MSACHSQRMECNGVVLTEWLGSMEVFDYGSGRPILTLILRLLNREPNHRNGHQFSSWTRFSQLLSSFLTFSPRKRSLCRWMVLRVRSLGLREIWKRRELSSQLLQMWFFPYIWDSKAESNWTEQSVQYSESEKRFKAFSDIDSAWALIATIIFFMTSSSCVISVVAVCETL